MKKYLLFFVFLPFLAFGQQNSQFEILEHGNGFDIIKVKVGAVSFHQVETPKGNEQIVSLENGSQLIEKGAPDLAKLSFSLAIPNAKDARVEIIESSFTDQNNIDVAPSKGKMYRHEDPTDYPYLYGKAYERDDFYPYTLTRVNTPYLLRNLRGQAIHVFPVQYNPISKTLRTYDEITLKVSYDQEATMNIRSADNEFPTHVNHHFAEIYKNQFLNYKKLAGAYAPLPQHGKMLILCPTKYKSAMDDFIDWKQRKGYEILFEITDTMTGGATEANLLARVSQYYAQHQIAYLLIVGDATDILAQNSYYTLPGLFGPSDWAYAYQSGNDHYPEFIVGRFSADTLQDVEVQVKRTIDYEKNPNTTGNWMHKQVAMGSDQGPGDRGQYDQEHLREIADSNINHGPYLSKFEFYDGTHGGNDAPGNPSPGALTDAINNGIGLLNYCGHGSTDIFITSSFTGTGQVPLLTNNNGEWPFIFSTACQNGNFVYSTCLGESLLRAADANGKPRGAVAAIMSCINQSWDPPMRGQDEMNALLRHTKPGTYQTTFGAITSSGIMTTNDHYNNIIDPNGGNEIADTWVVFGDPTVELYTDHKGSLTCTHNPTIGKGSDNFEINCSENNALIGLYYQGDFLASAVVENGKAVFNFPNITTLDTIEVTGTKQNFTPYYGQVAVINGRPFSVSDLEENNISVYPNPTDGLLRIEDRDQKIDRLVMYNLAGKIVFETTKSEINMSEWASGVYQLIIYTLDDQQLKTRVSKY